MSATPADTCPVGPNPQANPARHREDRSRWLAIREETIFLNDGILRAMGLLPHPFDQRGDIYLGHSSSVEFDMEDLLKIGTADAQELQVRLHKLCRATVFQMRTYHLFQHKVLKGMWTWKTKDGRSDENSSQTFLAVNASSTTVMSPKKKVTTGEGGMSSRFSLLLMVPLLKSQAGMDPNLASTTSALLLELLNELPPMSLAKEFQKSLEELEGLLEHWITDQGEDFQSLGLSTMIGLCCARGLLSSFLKTIELLQLVQPSTKLPVRKMLKKLEDMKIRNGQPCSIQGSQYIKTIPYDDKLIPQVEGPIGYGMDDDEAGSGSNSDELKWHVAATDGAFMFVSGPKGKGLSKIGTGLHGTIQGYVYTVNQTITCGFLAFGNKILVTGPDPDPLNLKSKMTCEEPPQRGKIALASVIDSETLNAKSSIWIRAEDDIEGNYKVVSVASDGYYFYIVRIVISDKELTQSEVETDQPAAKQNIIPVYLDVCHIVESGTTYFVYPIRPSQLLRRDVDPNELAPVASETRGTTRQIRVTTANMNTHSIIATATPAPVDPIMDKMTTLGIKVKSLLWGSMFTCGNYLTLLTDLVTPGPNANSIPTTTPLIQTLNRHFGASGNGLQHIKLQGTQIHISLNGKKTVYGKQPFSDMPARSSFQKIQVTISEIACTYDARNNLIWTVNGDYMDAFRNPGHKPPWYEHAQLMMHQTELVSTDNSPDLEASKVLNQIFTHIGVMASNFLSGDAECNIGFATNILKQLSDVTLKNIRSFDGTALTSVLLAFQAIVSQIKLPCKEIVKQFKDIQTLVLILLSDTNFTNTFPSDPSYGVYYEASKLFLMIFEYVYKTADKRKAFIEELLEWIDDESGEINRDIFKILKQILLSQFTMKLDEPSMNYTKGKKWIVNILQMHKFIGDSVQGTLEVFEAERDRRRHDKTIPVSVPVASTTTLYVSSVINCLLKTWTNSSSTFADDLDDVGPIFREVLNQCAVIVDKAIEFLSPYHSINLPLLTSVENMLKSSLLGLAVPQIFQCFCEISVYDVMAVEEVQQECSQLYVAITHLNDMIHEKGKELFGEFSPSEDWASKIYKPNAMQGHRVCESPHPVRDSLKLKETLVFNGARRLYLKFDPKCSTQYDYDKLVIYAGTDVGGKRIAEYGGNFYGYGTRTGNLGYWPSDFVRIEGDSLTYTFDVRSGREQHSPESALWGFQFAVYPIFDSEPPHDSLEDAEAEPTDIHAHKPKKPATLLKQSSFIERLTLLSLDVISCFVAKLAGASTLGTIEKQINSIFTIPLLSYIYWSETPEPITINFVSAEDIQAMRKLAHTAESPKMRVKMSEIIRPSEFQQHYVHLCLKFLEKETDDDFNAEEVVEVKVDDSAKIDCAKNPEVLREIFHSADAIMRTLVALTEMQLRFSEEVDDFICGVKSFQDAFFLDPNFDDADMVNLASVCDVTYDANNPGNAVNDISSIVQAFIESGSRPVLTKAEEVVDEIFQRMKYLLGAEKRRAYESFWDCKDFRTAKRRINQVQTFVAFPLDEPVGILRNVVSAVRTREIRGQRRSQGVQMLLKIVECSKHFSQSLITAGLRLQHCFESKDITCTGMDQEIMELSGRTIKGIVELAAKDPPVHRYAIALLCILPYRRRDENCLVESGLLELLDQLCAFQPKSLGSGKSAKVEPNQIGPLAWSAFQVLAGKCASWEITKSNDFEAAEEDHIALPVQISVNITNHLARATTLAAMSSGLDECDLNSSIEKACAPSLTESIQDVLGLLDTLRLTKLGIAILKQSPCICRLFSLLLDSRLSPRLVLTILRLLYTALPRVNNLDITDLKQSNNIPGLKKKTGTSASVSQDPNPYSVIASLLLSKLADFQVVCGSTHSGPSTNSNTIKNPDEASTSASSAPHGTGVPASTASPVPPPRANSIPKKNRSLTSDQSCKERNLYLSTHDPARNFLSGEVAEGLAAQIIRLLRLLLSTSMTTKEESKFSSSSASRGNLSSSSNTSLASDISEEIEFTVEPSIPSPWSSAVEQVLCSALKPLPKLAGLTNPSGVVLESYAMSARLVIASLSVLGSFNDTIRVSSICWILSKESTSSVLKERVDERAEWEFFPTKVLVRSVCNRTGIATVEILPLDDEEPDIISATDVLEVPISRLSTEKHPKWEMLPPLSTSAQREIAIYLRSLFVNHPHPGTSNKQDPGAPLKRQLPVLNQIFASANQPNVANTSTSMNTSESRTIAHGMTIVRLVAEVRTRSTEVLSIWLRRKEFVQTFLGIGSETELGRTDVLTPEALAAVLSLRTLAKESKASYRLESVESQVTRLRLLYRDCTKPPKLVTPGQLPQETAPTAGTSTANGTGATSNRATAPATAGAQVAGTASDSGFRLRRISDSLQDLNFTQFFPFLGDIESESEVSFAVAETGSEDGGSSGYASPLSASNTALMAEYDRHILNNVHDDDDDASSATTMSDDDDEMPALIEVTVQPVQIPTEAPIPLRNALPTTAAAEASTLAKKKLQPDSYEPIRGHVAKPKPESKEYSPSSILEYHLTPSATYDIRVFTGPIRYVCPCSLNIGTESDLLITDETNKISPPAKKSPKTPLPRSVRLTAMPTDTAGSADGTEDLHELLVRSWEQRVFPIIRRRFRNESERRDGLEQIKGALLMGMIDIARQTVEFLYEENGGIPRDLHLPTLEEIKVEASRFTMERIKVGMNVMIRAVRGEGMEDLSGSIIPKYAVGPMMRTFGLVGEVLDVDPTNELVLVEVYVETEGNLLRFWYPLKCLERIDGTTKPPLNAHTVNMFKLHSNLVSLEVSLSHLYCRTAFLQILNAYNADVLDSSVKTSALDVEPKRPSNVFNALEELDMENLQLRSEHGFSDFPLNGDLLTWNLGFGVPPLEFLTDLGNPSVVFYKNCTRLSQELSFVIERAGRKGFAALNQLTKEICSVLENAPDKFVTEEISLDKEGVFEVFLPDTAFTVVSIRSPPPGKSSPVPNIKEPCVHVYGMNGGDLRKYALACYPIQSLSSLQKGNLNLGGSHAASIGGSGPSTCTGRDCLKKKNTFPTILVPTDRISCSITPQALPGYTLQVQGIPTEFPLALLYCQKLIQYIQTNSEIARDVVFNLMSMLFGFLQKTAMPPTVKEWIFALLSETISVDKEAIMMPEFYSTQAPMIHRLFTELVILYEHETKTTTRLAQNQSGSANSSHGVAFGAGTTTTAAALPGPSRTFTTAAAATTRAMALNRYRGNVPAIMPSRPSATTSPTKAESSTRTAPAFYAVSSYLQFLMELCINLSQVAELINSPTTLSTSVSIEASPTGTPMRKPSGTVSVNTGPQNSRAPGGSTSAQARKIIKPVPRYAQKFSGNKKGTRSPFSDPKAISKPEEITIKECVDMPWFRQTLYAASVLKLLVSSERPVENFAVLNHLIQDCMESLSAVTATSRLFVITGAPNNIESMTIETSVAHALTETGGVYANELWISDDGVDVVLEVRTASKAEKAFEILQRNQTWYPIDNFIMYPAVPVFRVKNNLETGYRNADQVLSEYLRRKIFESPGSTQLSEKANEAVSNIFTKCYVANEEYGHFDKSELDETGPIKLRKKHILNNSLESNVLAKFVQIVKPVNFEMDYFLHEVFKKFGEQRKESCEKSIDTGVDEVTLNLLEQPSADAGTKKNTKLKSTIPKDGEAQKPNYADDDWGLSLFGFVGWCSQLAKDNVCALWRAFLDTGHDFRLDKVSVDANQLSHIMSTGEWTKQMDATLVTYVDQLAETLRLPPQNIHPHEIYLEENLFLNPELRFLKNIPIENIRSRFAILQCVNNAVQHNLLPYVPLHIGRSMKLSIAALVHDARYFLFYNTKDEFLYKVLQHSAQRGSDNSPPEVILDPIYRIGSTEVDCRRTLFSQAFCQLKDTPSSLFCVPPATGGDPPLPVIVKFSGEEVQGLIGSFRHFLGSAVEEFKTPDLRILMLCPSAAAGRNKDSFIIRPGPLSFGEENLMKSLGQFIGVCLRVDAPISISLLRPSWRQLLNSEKEFNDLTTDLKEVDVLTYSFLQEFKESTEREAFTELLAQQENPTFQFLTMDSLNVIPLCPAGTHLPVNFDNKGQYIRMIEKLREKELISLNRLSHILPGLASLIPTPIFFNLFTTTDLQNRVAGSPNINLALLKSHTHYQVGTSPTDRHILFFWAVLESMTPEELKNFVKFATNQERLPVTCPCQNHSTGTASTNPVNIVHVPPFPMKIAPIDMPHGASAEYINRRTIRAETCLFLIRLPPYTTYQVTRDQLLFACNSRDDPLSG